MFFNLYQKTCKVLGDIDKRIRDKNSTLSLCIRYTILLFVIAFICLTTTSEWSHLADAFVRAFMTGFALFLGLITINILTKRFSSQQNTYPHGMLPVLAGLLFGVTAAAFLDWAQVRPLAEKAESFYEHFTQIKTSRNYNYRSIPYADRYGLFQTYSTYFVVTLTCVLMQLAYWSRHFLTKKKFISFWMALLVMLAAGFLQTYLRFLAVNYDWTLRSALEEYPKTALPFFLLWFLMLRLLDPCYRIPAASKELKADA